MACESLGGQQREAELWAPGGWGAHGAWRKGPRIPDGLEGMALVWGDPAHPARLRPSDLEHPEAFHARLNRWLLQQG